MCLISETKEPSISTSDIHCYKILSPVGSDLITPYREFVFHINELMNDEANPKMLSMCNVYIIERGFFHSYIDLKAAKEKVEDLKKIGVKVKIYNAIIPANVNYYTGCRKDICSKSLKIVSECND